MTDRIMYLVISEPGGVDGLDNTDKGGAVVGAHFSKVDAERQKGNDSRLRLTPTVIDDEVVRAQAMAKLTLVERRVLFGHEEPLKR